MNIGLPTINGIETAKIIKNTNNKNTDTPIVATSWYYENKKRCVEAGIEEFLRTDIGKNEFRKIFEKYNLLI